MHVRTMRPEDVDAVAALTAQAFASEGEEDRMRALVTAAYRVCPLVKEDMCWLGEREDGRIIGSWQHYELAMRVGQVNLRVAGSAALAVAKDARGGTVARDIARTGIPEVATRDYDLYVGFAQRGGFYVRLGCVPLAPEHWFSMDARAVPTAGADSFRPFAADDLDHVLACYRHANQHRPLTLVRDATYWTWMQRRAPEIWVADDGYLGVRREPNGIEVRELAGTGPGFYRAALGKLRALARECGSDEVFGHVPADDPLVAAAVPYGAQSRVTFQKGAGCIGMIANLRSFLDHIAPELEARLTTGAVHIVCDGEALAIGRGRAVRIHVSREDLLQLVLGYRGAESVFDVADDDLAPLRELFPRKSPFIWATDRW